MKRVRVKKYIIFEREKEEELQEPSKRDRTAG
jgi:hypothetical protein